MEPDIFNKAIDLVAMVNAMICINRTPHGNTDEQWEELQCRADALQDAVGASVVSFSSSS